MALDREAIRSLWEHGKLSELSQSLAQRRTEWSPWAMDRIGDFPEAPALGILTLLEKGETPEDSLVVSMARSLAAAQKSDGSWGSPQATSLVVRALLESKREPSAFARGLAYLSTRQSHQGSWGEGDEAPLATAFVLSMLGDLREFQDAADVDLALDWYRDREDPLQLSEELEESSEIQWQIALGRVAARGPDSI